MGSGGVAHFKGYTKSSRKSTRHPASLQRRTIALASARSRANTLKASRPPANRSGNHWRPGIFGRVPLGFRETFADPGEPVLQGMRAISTRQAALFEPGDPL